MTLTHRRAAPWATWTTLDKQKRPVRSMDGSHLLNVLNYVARTLPTVEPSDLLSLRLLLNSPRFKVVKEIAHEARWRGLLQVGRTFRLGALDRQPTSWNENTVTWVALWAKLEVSVVRAAASAWRERYCPVRHLGMVPKWSPAYPSGVVLAPSTMNDAGDVIGMPAQVYVATPLPGGQSFEQIAEASIAAAGPPRPERRCRHCNNVLRGAVTWERGLCTRAACKAAEKTKGQVALTLPAAHDRTSSRPTTTSVVRRRIVVGD